MAETDPIKKAGASAKADMDDATRQDSDADDASIHASSDVSAETAGKQTDSAKSKEKDNAGSDEEYGQTSATQVIRRDEKLARIPHYQTRYYISQFEGELLDDFAELYAATRDHKKECHLINKVNTDELEAMIFALKYDCPELFCLDNIKTYYMEGNEERNIVKVNIDYVMGAEEYEEKLEEAQRTIQQVLKLCHGDSYENMMTVYEFLTGNCNYNLNTRNCGNAYGALIEKQTKCDGISLAYMWILEEMGEHCFVMAGKAPEDIEGHGWNVVRQGDGYYASDLTADLSNVFVSGKCNNWYPAFNTSTYWVDALYPDSEVPGFFSTISGDDMSESYHARNHSFCSGTEDEYQMIYDTIAEAADNEECIAQIQFETDEMYRYFLDEYGNIISDWAQENGCTNVEYTYGSVEAYRTVQIMVKAECPSGIETVE